MTMNLRLLLLGLLLSCSVGASAEDIIFATGEYPPYISENAPGLGTSAQIVKEACRRANLNPVFKFMPWSRVEHDTAEGKYIASFVWARTPEREKRFTFSRYPVAMGAPTAAFYKRKMFAEPPTIKSWSDFAHFKVVGIHSYWNKEYYQNAGADVFYVNTSEVAWKMIGLDRRVIYVDNLSTGLIEAKKYIPEHFNEIDHVVLLFDNPHSYIMYPLNNVQSAKLKERLDAALESMAKDGTLDKMAKIPDQK